MNQEEDIRFYCGVGEKNYNHHPVYTGAYACISPVTGRGGKDKQGKERPQKVNGVHIPDECQEVILDSGAYSDTTYRRCTFEEALERQLKHAKIFDYLDKLSHIASYDVLIDEQDRGDGVRIKERWAADLAEFAISKTIQAAEYLASKRQYIQDQVGRPVGLVLSAQGVDAQQYINCAKAIIPLLDPVHDIFGLGGWCILGQSSPKLLQAFFEAMNVIIPLLKAAKIKRVHIWGVCYAKALGPLAFLCDHYQREDGKWGWDEKNRIQLSTDSVGPTTRITRESKTQPGVTTWGYASWCNNRYPLPRILDSCKVVDADGNKSPSCPPESRCRGLERARHVEATREWLAHFREREPEVYRYVTTPVADSQRWEQLSWLDFVS